MVASSSGFGLTGSSEEYSGFRPVIRIILETCLEPSSLCIHLLFLVPREHSRNSNYSQTDITTQSATNDPIPIAQVELLLAAVDPVGVDEGVGGVIRVTSTGGMEGILEESAEEILRVAREVAKRSVLGEEAADEVIILPSTIYTPFPAIQLIEAF
ncbi:hypothetical protein BDP55DRAFT_630758 [Colletotrichum godetiae]|uniref:Uncharacterized protein n=1 Tax=Colletotrichum godetiae TaxID=1209918 RepID=A0AAJ0EVF3_9PEZI|nr:uncharacterized protein BDP55DRAFT_630758 [Colletotrichum godetiae]KAK1687565.1 hypothetical protein BDP55DRAFT_630758 [Colletotrichum godetiae]